MDTRKVIESFGSLQEVRDDATSITSVCASRVTLETKSSKLTKVNLVNYKKV
jgi:hypothetical protein